MGVRVRFAPSPTGLLHLGGARTALFNYLYATANRGQCILRIEDTDQGRSVTGSKRDLEETLQWLGIKFHESPSKGGPYAPYVQSERLHIYQRYARELLQRGAGYPCFCGKERLQSLRLEGQQAGYDGKCRSLRKQQADEEMNRGTPFTVRLKVPRDVVVVVDDAVYGQVEVSGSAIDDQVLLKTDGYPTYHLACVVDDHCMDISHVLRGEEWLLSTAKHLLLYTGLGWSPPLFAHLPLLLSSTGEKLSKRKHGTSVQSYRERGFLPESLIEFLSQLGRSGQNLENDKDTAVRQSLQDLTVGLSLESVSRRPAIVEEEKLVWMNKKHFRKRLQDPQSCRDLARELAECVATTLSVPSGSHTLQTEYLSRVLHILEDRNSLIPGIPVDAAYFWRGPVPDREAILSLDRAATILETTRERLSRSSDFTTSSLTTELREVSSSLGVPHKVTMQLCRAAVIGQETSPGVSRVCEVLGRPTVLERLQQSINAIR